MKKFIAFVAVCGFAFAFAACGGQKAEDSTASEVDTTTVEEQSAPVMVDTVATDTTGITADTTAH